MRRPSAAKLLAPLLLAVVSGSCAGSRGHDLLEGTYAFTEVQVLADACGLLPASGLWDGVLTRSGDYVRLDYDLLALGVVGSYRYDLEEFFADGTAEQVQIPAAAGQCSVDQVQLHLVGVTRSPTQFDGTMIVRTFASANESCECQLSVSYVADRQ